MVISYSLGQHQGNPIYSNKADLAIDAKRHPSSFRTWPGRHVMVSSLEGAPILVCATNAGVIHRVDIRDTSNYHRWKFLKTHSPRMYA
jgi:hypothetical protein